MKKNLFMAIAIFSGAIAFGQQKNKRLPPPPPKPPVEVINEKPATPAIEKPLPPEMEIKQVPPPPPLPPKPPLPPRPPKKLKRTLLS